MLPLIFHGSRLDQGFDNVLDAFLGEGATCAPCSEASTTVPLDIYEEADRFEVVLDVPGLAREEVKLELDGDTLTIRGERAARAGAADEKLFRRVERWAGPFARTLTLPPTVDGSRTEAHLKDGVLRLVLPKSEKAKAREIAIKD